jgi:hypothetical protein
MYTPRTPRCVIVLCVLAGILVEQQSYLAGLQDYKAYIGYIGVASSLVGACFLVVIVAVLTAVRGCTTDGVHSSRRSLCQSPTPPPQHTHSHILPNSSCPMHPPAYQAPRLAATLTPPDLPSSNPGSLASPIASDPMTRPPQPAPSPPGAHTTAAAHPAWHRLAFSIAAVMVACVLALVGVVGSNDMIDRAGGIAQRVHRDGLVTLVRYTGRYSRTL